MCNYDLDNPNSACTATQLEIKYKEMYDFVADFTFKFTEYKENMLGFIFRKIDNFNYYAI